MSKLKQPSVSDSFNAPKNQPDNPNGMNWKQMLFQLGLVIAGGVTFGLVIHYSNKRLIMLAVDSAKDNKQPATSDTSKTQNQLPPKLKEEILGAQILAETKNVKSSDPV